MTNATIDQITCKYVILKTGQPILIPMAMNHDAVATQETAKSAGICMIFSDDNGSMIVQTRGKSTRLMLSAKEGDERIMAGYFQYL